MSARTPRASSPNASAPNSGREVAIAREAAAAFREFLEDVLSATSRAMDRVTAAEATAAPDLKRVAITDLERAQADRVLRRAGGPRPEPPR